MKKPSIDELHTDVQLDVLDIKDFPYNKMDLDNFEDGTNIREELFNGAVADLVSNNNAEIVENTEECPTKKPKKRYVKKKKPHDLSKVPKLIIKNQTNDFVVLVAINCSNNASTLC